MFQNVEQEEILILLATLVRLSRSNLITHATLTPTALKTQKIVEIRKS